MAFPYGPITTRTVLETIEEGQRAWWVAALQINCNELGAGLEVDGIYGRETRLFIVDFQLHHGINNGKGMVGPLTSRAMCLMLTWPAQTKHRTPPGLARGMIEGESNFDMACVSEVYSNGRRDVDACQDNTGEWDSESVLVDLFNVRKSTDRMLGKVRRKHDEYVAKGCSSRIAWQLATLAHNRPADSDKLAVSSAGKDQIDWSVIPDKPDWYVIWNKDRTRIVASYSNRAWDQKYISDKTVYVKW